MTAPSERNLFPLVSSPPSPHPPVLWDLGSFEYVTIQFIWTGMFRLIGLQVTLADHFFDLGPKNSSFLLVMQDRL